MESQAVIEPEAQTFTKATQVLVSSSNCRLPVTRKKPQMGNCSIRNTKRVETDRKKQGLYAFTQALYSRITCLRVD